MCLGTAVTAAPFLLQNGITVYFQENGKMIYLKQSTEQQRVYIPRNYYRSGVSYILELRSTMDLTFSSVVIDSIQMRGMYCIADIVLPEGIVPGEYEYSLEGEGRVMSSGLATVKWEETVQEYERIIQYQQYE